jgi:hypothetical protein
LNLGRLSQILGPALPCGNHGIILEDHHRATVRGLLWLDPPSLKVFALRQPQVAKKSPVLPTGDVIQLFDNLSILT